MKYVTHINLQFFNDFANKKTTLYTQKLFGYLGLNCQTWLQQVAVRWTLSEQVSVLPGVPKGTALGILPIYINDMSDIVWLMTLLVKSTIALFADDTYLLKAISSQLDAARRLEQTQRMGKSIVYSSAANTGDR